MKGDRLVKLLVKHYNFKIEGIRGSHVSLSPPPIMKLEKAIIVIPMHSRKPIAIGLLRRIITDLNMSRSDFIKLYEENK